MAAGRPETSFIEVLSFMQQSHQFRQEIMLPFQASPPVSMSLLLVEDDDTAREVTAASLGHIFPFLRLYHASNGKEGLELYERHRPDIVLTDINMPILDGISMAQQILARDQNAHIIVISAHSEIPFLIKSIQLGIKQYVLKPLEHAPLFHAVSDCVKGVQLQRQLREQEQYIRLLSKVVEQNSSLIAIAGRDGKIIYANERYASFTGYRPEEILGRELRQLHFEGTTSEEYDELWSRITSGEEWRGEGTNRKRDGELYHEEVSIAPILDEAGETGHFVTIREDISSRKRSQQEMDRVQKLESLGVLAGGIAHDFNNILTGVLGNLSIALATVSEMHRLRKPLLEAEKAGLRAAALTRELLTFSRGGAPVKKEVSLRQLVVESASFTLRGANVQREVKIEEAVDALEVDEGQIRQAFNNILLNAVQAMPGGGTVSIKAENVVLGPQNELGLEEGSYVRISFADQGHGIAEGIRGRIFDPYFTTRSGRSGMGLASAHSIIARHSGHIGVDSTPGSGATFICHLPSMGAPLSEGTKSREQAPCKERPAGGAILIMDDESSVRQVAEKMFSCLGFRATSCSNGVDAIALYCKAKKGGKPFAAVIMDLTIVGGMGGKEAAQHILSFDPEARLVVSSGYSDDLVLAEPAKYGFCAVLPKPYRVANVAEVMSQVLTQTVPPPQKANSARAETSGSQLF